jgi:hypothetical protein
MKLVVAVETLKGIRHRLIHGQHFEGAGADAEQPGN